MARQRPTIRQKFTCLLLSLALCHSAYAFVNHNQKGSPVLQLRLREVDENEAAFTRMFVAAPRKQAAAKSDDIEDEKETKFSEQKSNLPRFVPPTPHDENRGSKFRKLKDMIWIRETVEDLTAAEFACSVEAYLEKEERKRRRAVDYDKLLAQLNKRLRDLGCGVEDSDDDMNVVCELDQTVGMGTTVYNKAERQELLHKILNTREKLISVIRGYKLKLEKEEDSMPFKINLPSLQIQKEENITDSSGPKLYVRDDGTVDWEGALQDRAALQMFGTAVWARINGRDPSSVTDDEDSDNNSAAGHHGSEKPVTAKIEDTPQIVEARKILNEMESKLRDMEREHTKLLRTALSEGQPVANVNLASLDPQLRSQIRESAESLDKQKQMVAYKTLVYEMERIYTYLVGEVGNPANKGYVPLQDRLNVAELGLLEAQIESFTRDFEAGSSVDADVLVVVGDQVTDLKRRLGIDFYVTGLTFDAEAIKRVLGDLWVQTKNGLAFYGRGCQLFWNDLVFCGFLVGRAAQGYTLKPREVRNLRRTTKDFFTFIPFIIILLIPLSPIGHVLVFGAIQRFFPDFFPSCFTEQRQNLLQLYENAEYSEFKINESFQQKISRLLVAAVYFTANTTRSFAVRISELVSSKGKNGGEDADKLQANGGDQGGSKEK